MSGVYHVTPSCSRTGYNVFCDMTTDGGGWLVIFFLSFKIKFA